MSDAVGTGRLLVALAGQQNAGKSTLFNALTGVTQHIANYPGVTVDKKSGTYRDGDITVQAVDLPGTYSLTSFSLEERVARQFLIDDRPDVIVNVLDASNLQRSLPLTFQLIEMGIPLVVVLNMSDVAEKHGLEIDLGLLETRLCVPVVTAIGRRGVGIDDVRAAIRTAAENTSPMSASLNYGKLEADVAGIQARLAEMPAITRCDFSALAGRQAA